MSAPFVKDRRERSYPNPWGAATGTSFRALCSDGRVRIATATAEPDTYFSIPARVQVRGRTVTGYVTGVDWYDLRVAEGDIPPARYEFRQYLYRRNAAMLPPWESVR